MIGDKGKNNVGCIIFFRKQYYQSAADLVRIYYMKPTIKFYPVYTSKGENAAFLAFPYLFNLLGEWIGWATQDKSVYSVHGQYVGYIIDGPRIVRRLSDGYDHPRHTPPQRPPRVQLPITVPLAPLMAELQYGLVDVLETMPELLPTLDSGERPDMD